MTSNTTDLILHQHFGQDSLSNLPLSAVAVRVPIQMTHHSHYQTFAELLELEVSLEYKTLSFGIFSKHKSPSLVECATLHDSSTKTRYMFLIKMYEVVKMRKMSLVVSFGSGLVLLAVASVILMTNTVHTSEYPDEMRSVDSGSDEWKRKLASNRPAPDEQIELPSEKPSPKALGEHNSIGELNSGRNATDRINSSDASTNAKMRSRSGRLYGQSSGLTSGNNIQQVASNPETYAAAYAALNSPAPGEQQSSVQPNDVASAYTSFGDAPPTSTNQQASSSLGSTSSQTIHQILMDHVPAQSSYSHYMSPSANEASYSHRQPSAAHHDNYHSHHGTGESSRYGPYQSSYYTKQPPLGYPSNAYNVERQLPYMGSSYYERPYMNSMTPFWSSGSSLNPMGSGLGTSGLMTSASSMLSHWTGGFSITEIICGIVAIAIGAIILGAPFFLIYLALMGNFSGSGSLSLTNPAAGGAAGGAAPANGRRKRLAIYEPLSSLKEGRRSAELFAMADSIVNQISPFIDVQQVANTLKRLVTSIEKYSSPKRNDSKKTKQY